MSEWISTKDKLPCSIGEYIITNGSVVTTLEWVDEVWMSDALDCQIPNDRVTHWMPLPELPRDEE